MLDDVLVLHGGGRLAASAAALGLVVGERLGLGVAGAGHGDHHVLLGDQVLDGEVEVAGLDLGLARVAELVAHSGELLPDHLQQAFGGGQDRHQLGDLLEDAEVLVEELLGLQAGQAVQAQLEDGLGLCRREAVLGGRGVEAEALLEVLGLAGGSPGALQHAGDLPRRPVAREQLLLGLGGIRRGLDQFDHLVDVGDGDGEALEDMAALPRLAQFIEGTPGDHLAAVADEGLEHLLEVEGARLAILQGDHVDAEDVLQLGLGEEVVDHHLAGLAALDLDHHPQAVLVGLVAQLGDALDALLLDQLGDLLDQPRLVHLVGQLGDDDVVAAALVVVLDGVAGAHVDTPAAGAVGLEDAGTAVDDAPGGEVRPGDVLHQVVDGKGVVVDQRQAGVDHLHHVVGRDIGGHAHGDARGAVDQQVGHLGGQHVRDALGAVVVVDPVDRLLLKVGQELMGQARHAHLGVAHGRGAVAIDGAEVALAVDQHVTHGEVLGHAHDGVVDGTVTVGVVLTDDIAHHAGGLLVGLVPVVAELVHGEQHAPVHRLEAIAHIRQRPADDHAHRVIEVRLLEFVLDVDWQNLSGDVTHGSSNPLHCKRLAARRGVARGAITASHHTTPGEAKAGAIRPPAGPAGSAARPRWGWHGWPPRRAARR